MKNGSFSMKHSEIKQKHERLIARRCIFIISQKNMLRSYMTPREKIKISLYYEPFQFFNDNRDINRTKP